MDPGGLTVTTPRITFVPTQMPSRKRRAPVPPIKEVWSVPSFNWRAGSPQFGEGLVFARYGLGKVRLAALDEGTGRVVWKAGHGTPLGVFEDKLVALTANRYEVLEARTGKKLGDFSGPGTYLTAVAGRVLVAQLADGLWAADLATGRTLWKGEARIGWGEQPFCVNGDRVVFGLEDGAAAALSLSDGRELWRCNLAELNLPLTSKRQGIERKFGLPVTPSRLLRAVAYRRSVIIAARDLVALSVDDGRVLWSRGDYLDDGYLCNEHYHVFGFMGGRPPTTYAVLDAATGRRRFKAELTMPFDLSWKKHISFGGSRLVVSESHVFIGTQQGAILTYARDSAAYEGCVLVGGNFGHPGGLVLAGGRLYASDMTRLRCFATVSGEADVASPGTALSREPKDGYLPFEILATRIEGKRPVHRCRTLGPTRATFLFAVNRGSARLWVETIAEGESLLSAFRGAFPPDERARYGRGSAVGAAMKFDVDVLWRDKAPSDCLATEWVSPDGTLELVVTWSRQKELGAFEEREDIGRTALLDGIAGLLKRAKS
jgi:outer membrane protein assembly factor BamB